MIPKIYPVKTEKSFKMANSGIYTFFTVQMLPKSDIINALKEIYDIDVKTLTSLIRKGKTKRDPRTRRVTRAPNFKKVFVTLKNGQTLDIFK